MTNLETYNRVFCDKLQITEQQLPTAHLKGLPTWDSVGHMTLLAALEDAFDIFIEPEDMMALNSYEEGKNILRKYDVEL
ncbi:MAG: acyl carrier protein [Paludibacteraceae bacterium]|nr:acyl carrier protein [Paludibacteraceae bacterium]